MNDVLAALRAAAEPTRLRLLALAATGAFCVAEFVDILGQSQPRLSRHLRLLHEAKLLERSQEGANVWFALRQGEAGRLVRDILARLPATDPVLQADRRQALRVLAERARVATAAFKRAGGEWDEMRALGLPADQVERALSTMVPGGVGTLLDIGTGTGRTLELLADRFDAGVGLDASRLMLALARARLGAAGMGHCTVRPGEMERLPFADGRFDVAVMQMVLHYADDPQAAILEAVRVLAPGGRLLVGDLAPHADRALMGRHQHRWPGFSQAQIQGWFAQAGLMPGSVVLIGGDLTVMICEGLAPAAPDLPAADLTVAFPQQELTTP